VGAALLEEADEAQLDELLELLDGTGLQMEEDEDVAIGLTVDDDLPP